MSEITNLIMIVLISEHAQKFHYDLNRVQVPKNPMDFLGYS